MLTATALLSVAACSEDTLEAYDTSTSALNMAVRRITQRAIVLMPISLVER